MASKTQIGNMALGRVGITRTVANIETERSQEAITLNLFYDNAVQATLKGASWVFARKYGVLQLIEENPTDEWLFSYRYPVDCKYFRRILTGIRNDPNVIPYEIAADDTGKIILTDFPSAQGEWTKDITEPSKFDDDFVEALSWRLGADIAPSLGRVRQARIDCLEMFNIRVSEAKANTLNESQRDKEVDAEYIRARD